MSAFQFPFFVRYFLGFSFFAQFVMMGYTVWACEPLGAQKVLVLQVTTSADSSPPISDERIDSTFLSGSTNVDGFWKAISNQSTWIEKFEVKGPILFSSNARCGQYGYEHKIVEDALKASKLSDEKISQYDRIFVVMPDPRCGFAGYSSIGCQQLTLPGGGTSRASLSLLLKTYFEPIAVIHEASHGLGFWHSRTRAFSSKPLGKFEKKGKFTEANPYSLMSSGGRFLGFPPLPQRAAHGLVPNEQITTISADSEGGVYRIYPRTSRGSQRMLGLKVERKPASGASAFLWIEYVQKEGIYDGAIEADTQGALIHYQDSRTGKEGHLLNFGNKADFSSAVLKGKWKDPYSSLQVEVLSADDQALDIRVWYEAP